MEKMSDKEKQLLRELQAKQKRISRADAKFWQEVEARKSEVLERLIAVNWSAAADIYGCSEEELYEYVTSDRQVGYYKKHR